MSNDKLQLFEDQPIRTAWDEENEEWYFSIVDVIRVLTDQPDTRHAAKYWSVMKTRLKKEGNQLTTVCSQLKLLAADGKRYNVTEHYENELFSSVEAGDVALLKRIVMQPLGGTPGKMSRDLLRQARYTFVAVATNATRAAIRGGLPGELAFSLSDLYCQQMDTMKNVFDIQMLSMRMLLDFTQKVAEAKKSVGYSRPIRRCIAYIHAHLHDPITVQ